MLSFSFFNDLKNAERAQYPAVVKKHCLTPADIGRVADILKNGSLESEWFNQLYITCKCCGLRKATAVFEKYEIPVDGWDSLEEKLYQRFTEECNRGKFNN